MRWVVSNWRLKLLALVMTLGLLAAVAFSQNPVGSQTRDININWANLSEELMLLQPPTRVSVVVLGLSNNLRDMAPNSVTATADLSGIKREEGTRYPRIVTAYVVPSVVANGVTSRDSRIPLRVTVDVKRTAILDVGLKVASTAQGWKVDKAAALDKDNQPAKVTVTGPASAVDGLKALVTFESQVNTSSQGVQSVTIQFADASGKAVKWPPPTFPPSSQDVNEVATIQISAVRESAQQVVVLKPNLRGQPQCGYRVAGLEVIPQTATIGGPADKVAATQSIDLPVIDLTGVTSNQTRVFPIQLPAGLTSDPARVTVNVVIEKVLNCTPTSPTPTPSPTPT
jgi:YbbR domain-containing protein